MLDNQKLGSFIAALRTEKGMKQIELAKKLKVSDKTISKWECGKGLPDIQLLQPLAAALGVSLLELFECERRIEQAVPLEEANLALKNVLEHSQSQRNTLYRVLRIVLLCIAVAGALVMLVCIVPVLMPVVLQQTMQTDLGTALVSIYGTDSMLKWLTGGGVVFTLFFTAYLWVADFTKPRGPG